MASLADLPELVGFFSYAREDDDDFKGTLSALRDRIQRELRSMLGRSRADFRLWQDKEAIPPGTLWENELRTAIDQAVFFIPIVTPTAVKSGYCKSEFEAFLVREKALGRADLVFPIYYIRVPSLERDAEARSDPVLSIVAARQWTDWRDLRLLDVEDPKVREAVARFCERIADTLQGHYTSPEERRRNEEAAETERLARETAARAAYKRKQKAEAERSAAAEEKRRQDDLARAEADRRRQVEESRKREEKEAAQRARDAEAARRAREREERAASAAPAPESGSVLDALWPASGRGLFLREAIVVLVGAALFTSAFAIYRANVLNAQYGLFAIHGILIAWAFSRPFERRLIRYLAVVVIAGLVGAFAYWIKQFYIDQPTFCWPLANAIFFAIIAASGRLATAFLVGLLSAAAHFFLLSGADPTQHALSAFALLAQDGLFGILIVWKSLRWPPWRLIAPAFLANATYIAIVFVAFKFMPDGELLLAVGGIEMLSAIGVTAMVDLAWQYVRKRRPSGP